MVIPTKSRKLETPMPFEGFVFSEETSFLSDAEYDASLRFLEYVSRSIEYRERLAVSNPEQAKIFLPDEGWHADRSIIIGDTGIYFEQNHQLDHQGPGGILPMYLKILRKCSSQILPESFPRRRGTANIWVNASYKG